MEFWQFLAVFHNPSEKNSQMCLVLMEKDLSHEKLKQLTFFLSPRHVVYDATENQLVLAVGDPR